ncbi:MAG: hypothetical protein A3H49_04335 [Nitrospirae bacterium RIFCSPLOWO2_02_FULL_62_14]|nr:MAG: hypothetical protein A3H49_04335 [Nitrospirae bacterium RIFCSPLOWO2_02_FULL_62_14]OGW68844.1 MAG: hypothetical protein A3A88_10345 [Nitrospirae bacterium RIFCSPLOWO2_01_FULL_62_17]
MNTKRLALASLAVFVVFFVVDGVVNNVLLTDLYKQTASVWRPDSEIQGNMWLMWLGTLILAPLFTLIYTKGYEANKPGLGQGVRYGLIVGVLLSAPQCLVWYAVLPIPSVLAFWWFATGMVESIAAGAAVGLIYRPVS